LLQPGLLAQRCRLALRDGEIEQPATQFAAHLPGGGQHIQARLLGVGLFDGGPVPALAGGFEEEVHVDRRKPRRRTGGVRVVAGCDRERWVRPRGGRLDGAAGDIPLRSGHLQRRLIVKRDPRQRLEIPRRQRPRGQLAPEILRQEAMQPFVLQGTRRKCGRGGLRCERPCLIGMRRASAQDAETKREPRRAAARAAILPEKPYDVHSVVKIFRCNQTRAGAASVLPHPPRPAQTDE
jgi:hypothetical protein